MKEIDVIRKTKNPLDKTMMIKAFQSMGIQKSDTIIVHSSLSKIGFVIGGAQAVVESLLETVSEGTLVMPSHSGDLSDPKDWENPPVPSEWFEQLYEHMPAFSEDLTPTRSMGKIADCFLRKSGRYRSNHPQVSFTAYGKDAKIITEGHALTPGLGMDSPLGKLYNLTSKIVLIGVSFDHCTAFHLSEAMTNLMPFTTTGSPIYRDGKREWVRYNEIEYDDSDFLLYGNTLLEEGIGQKYSFGLTDVTILPFKESVDRVKDLMLKKRFDKVV